jgi:hypothetical protein
MVTLNFPTVDLIRRVRALLTFGALIALRIALGKPRDKVRGARLVLTLPVLIGSPYGVTDGARTRDLRSHNPRTSVATGSRALQKWLVYAELFAGGCPPLLRIAPSVVSAVASNGIVGDELGPPCRTEYVVGRGDLVRDLVRAVEVTPAPPREKRFYYSTSPRAVHT